MRMINREELGTIVEMKLALLREIRNAEELTAGAQKEILACYQDLYDENRLQHFGWEEEGQLVACAGGFLKDKFPYYFSEATYYGLLGDVYSYPNYRKQGKIIKLTEKVIDWLRKKGAEEINLFASEAGRDIYKELGFVGRETVGSNFFNKFLRI